MRIMAFFLVFAVCIQFITIIILYADRMIMMYEKGEITMDILKMNNKIYDMLKWIAIVALPALSTFIVVIGKIWGWGDIAGMVAQTITAVAVLLGALLGISHIQYKNGVDDHANG